MNLPNRMIIYPKDIMNITGKSERTARRLHQQIREQFQKPKGAMITVEEFCLATGFKAEAVLPFLQ